MGSHYLLAMAWALGKVYHGVLHDAVVENCISPFTSSAHDQAVGSTGYTSSHGKG